MTSHLSEAFERIKESCFKGLEDLQKLKDESDDSVKFKFEFIKDEIDVRIDSLKVDLESFGEELKDQVDHLYAEYLKYVHFYLQQYFLPPLKLQIILRTQSSNYDEYSEKLNELIDFAKNNEQQTQEKLEQFNEILSDLQLQLLESNGKQLQVTFEYGNFTSNQIGEIWIRTNVDDQIKSKRSKSIELSTRVYQMNILPNNILLVCGRNNINLYDKRLRLIKTINKINNVPIKPYFVSTNGVDRLFISEMTNTRIIVTDLDFNFIKYSQSSFLSSCYASAFKNNFLYVCDFIDSKVCRFESDIEERVYFQLDRPPWDIKILDDTACIGDGDQYQNYSISFYSLANNNFSLLKRYDRLFGSTVTYNNQFYHMLNTSKIFYVYNDKGEFVRRITTTAFDDTDRSIGGDIVYFNGNFLVSTINSRKIIVI